MSEEPERESESVGATLVNVLYHRLGVGEMNASLIVNGFLREVILQSLIRANILTKDELKAALDRAEKELEDIASEFDKAPSKDEAVAETIQKMKARAKHITDGIRERLINNT